jgi:hypothetical protein
VEMQGDEEGKLWDCSVCPGVSRLFTPGLYTSAEVSRNQSEVYRHQGTVAMLMDHSLHGPALAGRVGN